MVSQLVKAELPICTAAQVLSIWTTLPFSATPPGWDEMNAGDEKETNRVGGRIARPLNSEHVSIHFHFNYLAAPAPDTRCSQVILALGSLLLSQSQVESVSPRLMFSKWWETSLTSSSK